MLTSQAPFVMPGRLSPTSICNTDGLFATQQHTFARAYCTKANGLPCKAHAPARY
jgi:hypothetical protein